MRMGHQLQWSYDTIVACQIKKVISLFSHHDYQNRQGDSTNSMDTKHDRVVAYDMGPIPKKSNHTIISM